MSEFYDVKLKRSERCDVNFRNHFLIDLMHMIKCLQTAKRVGFVRSMSFLNSLGKETSCCYFRFWKLSDEEFFKL